MSLISKQIEELRAYAADRKGELAKIVSDAADTIETLSEKLYAANMERSSQYYNNGWIPVTERLPEAEHGINKLVLTTCEEPEDDDLFEERICWLEILLFDGRNWCYLGGERYEHDITAWMPLPEPYKEVK